MKTWFELMCVRCGLVVEFSSHGSLRPYPSACPANAGGDHLNPRSIFIGEWRAGVMAELREIRAATLVLSDAYFGDGLEQRWNAAINRIDTAVDRIIDQIRP